MELRDYPRPKDDTGIGVHWNAGFPAALGLGQIRDVWLPELKALGVKWVKLARHDGGLELAELLLKNDIMPVVRLYRPRPNPGTLDEKALSAVRDYVAAGVRYFEFNNEPDLAVEWQNNFVPPDALEVVARNAISDIEAILQRGGYPGIPALAVGCKWDLVGEICRLGRRDLLREPVWQAIHNYSLNHPLDYPYDHGNQEGVPFTQEFYARLAGEKWEGDAWGGWSLARVNQERRAHANPGATAFDDPSCWRAYERYDRLIRDQIGRSLPILATENGYIVGERPDPRYPATTPQLHMAQTLEACRIMMGTSNRFDHAPDYYFCTAFWLLGNYALGHWAPEWESQAWYSNRWPGGQLPCVAALKAEPKRPRPWRGDAGLAGRVAGILQHGAGLTVRLERTEGSAWALTTRADADGRYEFIDLPLARYNVTVVEAGLSQALGLTRERPTAAASFDLSGITITLEASVVRGVVRGGAGSTVRLSRPADGGTTAWTQEQPVAADGTFRFTGLRAGLYSLAVLGTDVTQTGIALDGRNEVAVELTVPGWGWEVTDGGPGPGFGVVRCRVTGRPGTAVRLWTVGWDGMTQTTGSKPEYGADACEFAPLGAGTYFVQPVGPAPTWPADVKAQVTLDGGRVAWVTFSEARVAPKPPTPEPTPPPVPTPPPGPAPTPEPAPVPPAPAPTWRGRVEDGGQGPGFSVVRCRVVDNPGQKVRLWTPGWGGITQTAGSKAEYGADACEFAPLGAGRYFVELIGQDVQAEVNLEPNRIAWVYFEAPLPVEPVPVEPVPIEPAPVEPVPIEPVPVEPAPIEPVPVEPVPVEPVPIEPVPVEPIPVEPTPPPPQQSAIAGSVVNGEGRVVILSGPTGDQQTVVQDGRFSFEGLPAGTYQVTLMEADPAQGAAQIREEILLDGTNRVTVEFVLPAPLPAQSRVFGRVRGGAGQVVILTGDGEARTTVVAADETYDFSELPAGTYQATVEGAEQVHSGIELDGTNAIRIDFDLNAIGPAKTIEHYLMVGNVARSKDDFLAVLRYVRRFRPVIGSDEAEARTARHVTILGNLNAISALTEQGLRLSGCQVQRIEADYAEKLDQLLSEDRPY